MARAYTWNKNIWIRGINLVKSQYDCVFYFSEKSHIGPTGAWLAKIGINSVIAWNTEDWSIYELVKLQPCMRDWGKLLIIQV